MRDTTAGACLIFIAEIVNFFFLNWDSLHATMHNNYKATIPCYNQKNK